MKVGRPDGHNGVDNVCNYMDNIRVEGNAERDNVVDWECVRENWIATIAIVGLSTEGSNRKNRLRERLPESSDVLWAREM